MSEKKQVRELVWKDFMSSTPKKLSAFKATIGSPTKLKLTNREMAQTVPTIEQFSDFNESHLAAAKEIWTEMFRLANDSTKTDTEAITDAYNYYSEVPQNPELKYYALMVFITHNERAKRVLHGTIPGIAAREPQKVAPSRGRAFSLNTKTNKEKELVTTNDKAGATDPLENEVSYFREDPSFNEHHERWHVVYPNGGIPYTDDQNNIAYRERERHGEMFIYMHQQMIAHYDANRLASGLAKVEPFDFSTPVAVGYDPGKFVQLFGDIVYSKRKKDWTVIDMNGYTVVQHRAFIKRLEASARSGYVEIGHRKVRITADVMGMLIESLGGNVEKFGQVKSFYGNVHNLGHNLLSFSPGGNAPLGVMCQTATAVRDPIFFRWHKHIDDNAFILQETKKAIDFSDAPEVIIRAAYEQSPDIILCSLTELAQVGISTGLSEAEIGQQAFGGDNWNKDFTDSIAKNIIAPGKPGQVLKTYSEIDNYLQDAEIIINDPESGKPVYKVPYQFLNHRQYAFFIRLENLLPVAAKVTVRMFLVPEAEAENRRMWMELDKFVHEMAPFAKDVVFRKDVDSAVVRKPAIIDPEFHNADLKPVAMTDMESWYTAGTKAFIDVLAGLIIIKSADPVNNPDLYDYYNTYVEATSGSASDRDKKVAISAFKNILDKYFNNLKVGWQELKNIKYSGFEQLLKDTENAFILTVHSQTLGEPVAFFNALVDFIKAMGLLLNASVDTLLPELNTAMLQAFQKVFDTAYCECGLPYNLLYPKGTAEGMPYYLAVMITDWNKDISSDESCCGSMSYCGTKGSYPDIREMGYPFNRPFKNGILNTFATLENIALRPVNIKLIKQPA